MSRSTHPREFIGLLRSGTCQTDFEGKDNKKAENGQLQNPSVIREVVILPLSTYGYNFSSLRLDMLPVSERPVGIVHSHPGPSNKPSKQDLMFFSRFGHQHLIISYPYTPDTLAGYDNHGNPIDVEVVD